MIAAIRNVLKYLMVVVLLMLVYFIYFALITPYLVHRRYKKYQESGEKNIFMIEKFIPFFGILKIFLDDKKQGKMYNSSYKNMCAKLQGQDV